MALTPDQALLGRLAVHFKLVSAEQLSDAVRAFAEQENGKPFGEVMRDRGLLTGKQLDWLLAAQQQVLAKHKPAAPAPSGIDAIFARGPGTSAPVAAPFSPPPSPSPGLPAAAPPPSPIARGVSSHPAGGAELRRILTKGFELKASDVHIHAGAPIQVRLNGKLVPLDGQPSGKIDTERILIEGLTPEQQRQFYENLDIDFAYSIPGVGRFRANIYRQQRGVDGVFRPIPTHPPTLEQLGMPANLARLTSYHQGLVLVTGPAGCGKSSTLAALVNLINQNRPDHILTVEDPIEFVHTSKRAVINQRQVVTQTATFASALRAALREDPDVIVIGELRDLETVSLAITAAETGHLVMATLHTNNTIRTINRILDVFPPKQQPQIRAMVSESLRAIISQRLVPTDGQRRVPALEILFVKPAISNLIRDQKTFQIRSILQTGRSEGMCLLDDSLLDLVKAGTITKEAARRICDDPKRFA